MANSKIYLGNTNVGSLFQGASDVSIYLGENKVYPLETPLKFQATYSGGETYELACDGNTTLTSGNTRPSGYEASAMTDATIGECVTTIGAKAFSGCSSLSSVTIPSGVTNIEINAFNNCNSLTSVTIPNGIIGSSAFIYCSGLTSVNLGSGVTTIGGSAFWGCTSLSSITIPSGVTSIGQEAFRYCSGLTSVNLGSGVTTIGSSAFNDCDNLTSIDIPDNVTSIGNSVFSFCNRLTNVTIGSGVTSIGDRALEYCTNLSSVAIEATVPPTLGTDAFNSTSNDLVIYVPCESVEAYKSASGWSTYASRITCLNPPFQGKWKATYSDSSVTSAECDSSSEIVRDEINKTNLVSAEIGDCVTSIGDYAFSTCENLTSCTIGNGVTSIGYSAFAACSSLTSIVIPDSVTSIGERAFRSCTGLTSIDIPNSVTSIGVQTFRSCSSLTNIDIPSGVTSIGNSAFEICSSLTSIDIPSGVTSIGNRALDHCTSLTGITIEAVTPPTLGGGAFASTNDCPIYVPCESVEAYKSASEEWSRYASRITCLNPPTYKYGVDIQGLEGKDTCDIVWKNIKIDYSVGNGSYTITTTADTVNVSIANYDSTNYSVDYDSFTLTNNNPSKTVTFTYQGGGNLQYIPQGTDMKQYYNRTITRFKIGDQSFPSGYESVNPVFQTGGYGNINSSYTNFRFDNTWATSLPCDVSGSDSLTEWNCFDSSWAPSNNNPFIDLWIEFA